MTAAAGRTEGAIIDPRSGTAGEERACERASGSRPRLVRSSGFDEWKPPNCGPERPSRINREDDSAFAMVGR